MAKWWQVWRRDEVRAAADVPERPPRAALARLFEPQAVDQLAELLTQFRDPDVILQKAGLTRAALKDVEADDEVAAALETRWSALIGTPWRLEPGDGPVVEWLWEELEPWMDRVLRWAWQALLYGYSVMEVTYRRAGERIGIAAIDERPIEWFTPQADGSLVYHSQDGGDVLVDTEFKFLLTRRNPTTTNPRGQALLSVLYWPWFFRTNGWKFWARFLERHGAPLLIGRTVGDPNAMAAALAKAVQSAVLAVGREDEVEAVSPANAGEAFDRFSRAVNKRIQKVILGQTLTSDVDGGGSYAAAKVHAEVRDDRRRADVRLVVPTVQRLVNALTVLNFPAAEIPAFVMEDQAGLELDRATRDALLVRAGVLRLTEQYLLDRYDFEPGDFIVESAPEAGGGAPVQASLLLAAKSRFDAGQESLDHLAARSIAAAGQPVDPALIRKAVFAATDPEDLARRLAALVGGGEAFQRTLEQALFVADVLGYVAADAEG